MDKFRDLYASYNAGTYQTYRAAVENGDLSTSLQDAFFAPLARETQAINDAYDEMTNKSLVKLTVSAYFVGLVSLVTAMVVLKSVLVDDMLTSTNGMFAPQNGVQKCAIFVLMMVVFFVVAGVSVVVADTGMTYAGLTRVAPDDLVTKLRVLMASVMQADVMDKLGFETDGFMRAWNKYVANKDAVAQNKAHAKDKKWVPKQEATAEEVAAWQNTALFHATNVAFLNQSCLDFASCHKKKLASVVALGCVAAPVVMGGAFGFLLWQTLALPAGTLMKGTKGMWIMMSAVAALFLALAAAFIATKINRVSETTCTTSPTTFEDDKMRRFYSEFVQLRYVYPGLANVPPKDSAAYAWVVRVVAGLLAIMALLTFGKVIMTKLDQGARSTAVFDEVIAKHLPFVYVLVILINVVVLWGRLFLS